MADDCPRGEEGSGSGDRNLVTMPRLPRARAFPGGIVLLTVALSVASLGCIIRLDGFGGKTGSAVKSGAFTGSECDAYRDIERDDHKLGVRKRRDGGKEVLLYARRVEHDERAQVTALSCADATADNLFGSGIPADTALAQDHYAFHDRRFDHARAAIMVVDCGLNDTCVKDRVGPLHWYATKVQPKRVQAALRAKGIGDDLAKGFLARFEQAKGVVEKRVNELDARRRHMYVDVPRQQCDEREAYYHAHRDRYAKLDELFVRIEQAKSQRKVPAALIVDMIELRDDYFQQCAGEDCRYDLFPVEITEQLVTLALIADDDGLALAEERLLREDGARIQSFSAAILAAMMQATKKEAASWEKYEAARKSGVDEAALAAKFGEPPPAHVSPDAPWFSWGKGKTPNYVAAVEGGAYSGAAGDVQRVVHKGDVATIHFSDRITKYDDADCYDTARVVAIRDGRLVYGRHCTNFRTRVVRDKVEPIEVPSHEAKALRPGEGVVALVDKSRRGRILSAKHAGRLTQHRSHRIKPALEAPKKREL